jgi:hypothetical protein
MAFHLAYHCAPPWQPAQQNFCLPSRWCTEQSWFIQEMIILTKHFFLIRGSHICVQRTAYSVQRTAYSVTVQEFFDSVFSHHFPQAACTPYSVRGQPWPNSIQWGWSNLVYSVQSAVCSVHCTVSFSIPNTSDRILIGQKKYRLLLAPLNEYSEPWCWNVADRKFRALASLGALKKTQS